MFVNYVIKFHTIAGWYEFERERYIPNAKSVFLSLSQHIPILHEEILYVNTIIILK